jgi:hypothetical protein
LSKPVTFVGFEGPAAQGGPDFMNGMRLAVNELNAKGDRRQQVKLTIVKTGGTPQARGTAYRAASQDSSVMGKLSSARPGPWSIKTLSERAKLPAIAAMRQQLGPDAGHEVHVLELLRAGIRHVRDQLRHEEPRREELRAAFITTPTSPRRSRPPTRRSGKAGGLHGPDVESASATASVDQLTPAADRR